MNVRRAGYSLGCAALIVFTGRSTLADVPRLISYQGELRTADGRTAPGPVDFRIRLYDHPTAAAPVLFDESHPAVALQHGLFNVLVGARTPGGVPDEALSPQTVYMGVAVNDRPELLPRTRIVTTPYGVKAKAAERLVRPDTLEPVVSVNVAGQVGVGDANDSPHPSALLDLRATDKGLLPPRLTTAERDTIANPADGLLLFNTTSNCLEVYIAGGWRSAVCAPAAGCTGAASVSACSSCKEILDGGASTGDAAYWIDPDGAGGADPFRAYCDMTSDGGGWSLAGVISTSDAHNWTDLAAWKNTTVFGDSASSDYAADMKNPAWSTLPVSQIRLEKSNGGWKLSNLVSYASLAELFSSTSRVSLSGTEAGWEYVVHNEYNFFAEVQNPPLTQGINLGNRNICVLTTGWDHYEGSDGPSDHIEGFGCLPGTGPVGVCGGCQCRDDSCADHTREHNMRVFVR